MNRTTQAANESFSMNLTWASNLRIVILVFLFLFQGCELLQHRTERDAQGVGTCGKANRAIVFVWDKVRISLQIFQSQVHARVGARGPQLTSSVEWMDHDGIMIMCTCFWSIIFTIINYNINIWTNIYTVKWVV